MCIKGEFKNLEDIRNFEYIKVYSWLVFKKIINKLFRIPRKIIKIIKGVLSK